MATWNHDEVKEDPLAFTAAINAVILATKLGAHAVREQITKGDVLESLIEETFSLTHKN